MPDAISPIRPNPPMTCNWLGGEGQWNNPACWEGGNVPRNGDSIAGKRGIISFMDLVDQKRGKVVFTAVPESIRFAIVGPGLTLECGSRKTPLIG